MKITRLFLLTLMMLQADATVIENPFLHRKELNINGFTVLHYAKYDSSQALQSSGSVKGTLLSREDFYGEKIEVIKINITETPTGGSPVASEMNEIYIDEDFAFNSTVTSFKSSSSILNRSVGKAPSTANVKIGDSWQNIAYRTGSVETYVEGNNITLPIKVGIETNASFLGLENIETIWGIKTAAVVESKKMIQMGEQVWQDGSYSFKNTFDDTYSREKDYYLRGMGLYKREVFTDPTNRTFTSTYVPNGYTESYPYPSPQTTEILIYEYSSRNLSPSNFSEVDASSNFGDSVKIDSWTWNGAFPWVYNNSTESWFYYLFTNDKYNAYDARNGNWLSYNSESKTWTPN